MTMNDDYLKLCAWCGVFFTVLLLGGYLTFGFLPPLDPLMSAEQVSRYYQDNIMSIRLGLFTLCSALAFYVPFYAGVTHQMIKMKNPSLIMVMVFVIIAAALLALVVVALVIWAAASYRPENPEATMMFNDIGFMFFLWPATIAPIANMALGLAILNDHRNSKIFPRWFAFYNFWSALLALTGILIVFFKTGPFAINGLFGFWVNAAVFFLWYPITTYLLFRSIKQNPSVAGSQLVEPRTD